MGTKVSSLAGLKELATNATLNPKRAWDLGLRTRGMDKETETTIQGLGFRL